MPKTFNSTEITAVPLTENEPRNMEPGEFTALLFSVSEARMRIRVSHSLEIQFSVNSLTIVHN